MFRVTIAVIKFKAIWLYVKGQVTLKSEINIKLHNSGRSIAVVFCFRWQSF